VFFAAMDSRFRGNDGLEAVPHAFHPEGETVFPGKALFCQAFPRRAGFNGRF
jgi:hypothetical protein